MRLCKVGWCEGGGEMRTEQLEHFECLCELMGGVFDLNLRSLCLCMLNLKVTGGFLGGCPAVVVLISCPKRLLYYIIYYLFLSVVVESLFRRLHPRIQLLTALKKLTSWLNNMQMLKKKKSFLG